MTTTISRRSTPYHRLEIYQPQPPRTTAAAIAAYDAAIDAADAVDRHQPFPPTDFLPSSFPVFYTDRHNALSSPFPDLLHSSTSTSTTSLSSLLPNLPPSTFKAGRHTSLLPNLPPSTFKAGRHTSLLPNLPPSTFKADRHTSISSLFPSLDAYSDSDSDSDSAIQLPDENSILLGESPFKIVHSDKLSLPKDTEKEWSSLPKDTEKEWSSLPKNTEKEWSSLPKDTEKEWSMKVVRSLVAGILLKLSSQFSPFLFTDSANLLFRLQDQHILSEPEKQALVVVGGRKKDEKETLISAINSALLLIEIDTGAITCSSGFHHNFKHDTYSYRVTVSSVQPDKLVSELLPVCLQFGNLRLTSEDFFPDPQKELDRELKIQRLLSKY